MESRFAEQNAEMIQVTKFCAGCRMAKNASGKFEAVSEDDPRQQFALAYEVILVNGRQVDPDSPLGYISSVFVPITLPEPT